MSGVFGVPLELLVEREGADSLLGATRANLRIPSFIDDVVSAMRQMGAFYLTPNPQAKLIFATWRRHVHRRHIPKKWEY